MKHEFLHSTPNDIILRMEIKRDELEEHAKEMRTQGADPWVLFSYTGADARGHGRARRRQESVGRGGKSWHSEAIALC